MVLSRLMLKAMRNFRAPVTVAPQLGTKELGPKSGAHSACLSCREAHPRVLYPREGHPTGAGERKRVRTPTGFPPDPPAIGGHDTFSGRASYSPARMAGRVWRLAIRAASPYRYTARGAWLVSPWQVGGPDLHSQRRTEAGHSRQPQPGGPASLRSRLPEAPVPCGCH